ncbi:MAG: hypothetical protein A3K14_07780 [Sulfurimonas sp. RIFCSPLOWO2_12_FULL_36_74]|uniref:hypothetical protein n=1 Tax=Sulfurimonas sp. RIFCSPLOWO2_12_36_12 TaxID=1802253 RepID=UPI0008D3BF51|nr:hypothetical protein [Sulfurimonas sp. RIFCSPLOWO2_12_36_12]OHD97466.1 MAG: hypothetical protein A3J26_08865 [Sulfurimonas sp. RIFCSPLOWO2_02_FULL_36_28]OHE01596.1 MAG: hypothetical protein A2W82_08410 [Sulfurimonas sp. RIFCSPLOWO2_12_36_12]OHE07617.1 MAG: hypothetical protein A3K14_07780 [Sulfurimonas sp. RIFCSPLOWO2_12_FULL_36_74]
MNLKLKIFFTLILVANVFFIVYYQAFIYRAFFNSDAAIANILAQEIINQASYYPNSWWYVNGDIWTVFKHTLAVPLTLLGIWAYNVHTIVVIGFFAFSLFVTYKYLKKIGTDTVGILIAFIGMSTLYSPMYAREVFGESAYIWYYTALISYLYFFYILSQEEAKTKKVWIAGFFIVFLTIVFVAENPSRFAIYFIASLFVPLFLFYQYINIKYKKIVIYFTLGILLGIVYRYYILSHIQMQVGVEKTFLISYEELPTHIWRSFIGLANFYGADWGERTTFASFEGAIYMLKSLLFPIAFFAPLFYAVKNRNSLNSFEIYTVSVGYIAFLIVFGIYCITSLHFNGLYAARENIRYIIPFVLIISISNGIVWKFFSQKIKLLLILSILLSLSSIFNTLKIELSKEIVENREEVIGTLLDNNLTKGYAPYWHSHIFTVLSDNKIEVRPIEDDDNKRKAGEWLTSSSWYDRAYVDKNSFILLPKEKVEEFEKASKEFNLTEAVNKIELKGYNIYVYDKNPINNKK